MVVERVIFGSMMLRLEARHQDAIDAVFENAAAGDNVYELKAVAEDMGVEADVIAAN